MVLVMVRVLCLIYTYSIPGGVYYLMTINDLTILWLLMILLSYVQASPRLENADLGDSQCK